MTKRVAVAGFLHESNTFNPRRTTRRDFEQQTLVFGDGWLRTWRQAHHEVAGFFDVLDEEGLQGEPLLLGWATPGGPVDDAVFDEVADYLTTRLGRGTYDGLLLALHGALVTPRWPDADAELLRRIRRVVGAEFPLAVTFDLHGNLPATLADWCKLVVAYRTNPHVDQRRCGQRAARLLLQQLRGQVRPTLAVSKPPVIISLPCQDTSERPLRAFYEALVEYERQPSVLAVSFLLGFPYADVPDMGPTFVAVTDRDELLAEKIVAQLAERLWQERAAMHVELPLPAEAVHRALASEKTPVILVDFGDNVGGGSAADGTVLLAELLRQGASDSVVCLYDPEAVRACSEAGVGATITLAVGGKTDAWHGPPVEITGRVCLLHPGTYEEREPRHGGLRLHHMGLTALLELPQRNWLILTSLRHPPFSLGQLTCLGLEPQRLRIIVVKGAIAWKAAYLPIAGTVIGVDTPGLTPANVERLPYRRIRPMYPLTGD
ncbi:MAG: M81 family metallopeptidase [Gemmatales bacterium]|nr:M81 family metallopeptidase [Gemmatales bacterium]MDW7993841.1 M81 family metallopeptidase [Gemmatales bacterium]